MSLGWHHLILVVAVLLGLLTTIKLFHERSSPASVFSWLVLIVLIPYIGIPIYWLFGGRKLRSLARADAVYAGQPGASSAEPSRVELLQTNVQAWEALLRVIRAAKRTLVVETFILGRDEIGESIVAELATKSRQGLKVRLLVDALGSLKTRGDFLDPIRNAGGEVAAFLPILPIHRRWSLNLRNHRKLIVADSTVAVVGGMNLAAEYLGPGDDSRHWIDVGCQIEGPAAQTLETVFAADWDFARDGRVRALPSMSRAGNVEIITGGPTCATNDLRDAILLALAGARSRIRIVTPYFVPDQALMAVLCGQARRGCRIDLVLPARSNHHLADLARGANVRDLIRAGVNVVVHPDRMVHAKILTVDDALAVLGSANLDLRSLYLNFELCAFLSGHREVVAAARWIDRLAAHCLPAPAAPPSRFRGLTEDLVYFVSPLL
ncbi:MAG: PLDc N-terminal domain-containing protein [Planctomycetes bacterium]|nr:PLDc N-terminal domain-containing protein [Planctomycetota bacterium]